VSKRTGLSVRSTVFEPTTNGWSNERLPVLLSWAARICRRTTVPRADLLGLFASPEEKRTTDPSFSRPYWRFADTIETSVRQRFSPVKPRCTFREGRGRERTGFLPLRAALVSYGREKTRAVLLETVPLRLAGYTLKSHVRNPAPAFLDRLDCRSGLSWTADPHSHS